MATPLNQRANSVFLSHSGRDKIDFVDGLYQWLTQWAGLRVWYDRNLGSGQVAPNIEQAIDSSKAAVVVLSRNAARSQWVELECSRLHEEVARSTGDFRIATLRLDDADPPSLLKAFKSIELDNGAMSASVGAVLLDSLLGGRDHPTGKSVYVSRGWRAPERQAVEPLCEALRISGLRLVCDRPDQPRYDVDRVREIMESTGGLVAILPHRGEGRTSSYILSEIQVALDARLPVLVFAHQLVVAQPSWPKADLAWFGDDVATRDAQDLADAFAENIERLAQEWRKPVRGEHLFLGHALDDAVEDSYQTAQIMLSRTTGLQVEVGGLVRGPDAQQEIARLIREANLCIFDLSKVDSPTPGTDFAMNSSIEAGIAIGAGKTLYLTCRGPRRSPPFMFRNRQVFFYDTPLELVGVLGRITSAHRRMIL
jgi:hypothetical protein